LDRLQRLPQPLHDGEKSCRIFGQRRTGFDQSGAWFAVEMQCIEVLIEDFLWVSLFHNASRLQLVPGKVNRLRMERIKQERNPFLSRSVE
jgi:hypothetical protein